MKRYAWIGLWLGMTLPGSMAHADDWQSAQDLMDANEFAAAAEIYKRMDETNDLRATNILAIMYSRGTGVERDIDKALEYALKIDKAESTAHTQGFISLLYMMHTPADAPASYAWLKKATSTQVIPGLFFRLARYYESGVGTSADPERAYVWYLMSMKPEEVHEDRYRSQKRITQMKLGELRSALSKEKAKAASSLAETCYGSRSEACY